MKAGARSIALVSTVLAALLATSAAHAADAPDAAAACERAARETLRSSRGALADATFTSPATVAPGLTDGDEVTLRGAGRYKAGNAAPRPFSYSCTVHRKTASVSGVVLRDAAPAAAAPAAPRPVEPDLTQVSPEACQAQVAAVLKRRWPVVSRIAFAADSLQLQQDAAGQSVLRGQGSAQPAPGEAERHFGWQCTLDARTGRVVYARIDG